MASETVLSDHHSVHPEEVEKEVQSELTKMEAENVSLLKESVGSTKTDDSACPPAPSAATEAQIEKKQIEPPPVVENVKDDIKADEKPKAEDSVDVVAEQIEKKTQDKPVEDGKNIEVAAPSSVTIQENKEDEKKTEVAAPSAEPIEEKIDDEKKTEGAAPSAEPIKGKKEDEKKTEVAAPSAELIEDKKEDEKKTEVAAPSAEPIEDKKEDEKKTEVAAPSDEPIEDKKEDEKKTEDAPILEPSIEKLDEKLESKSTEEKAEEPAKIVDENIEKQELPAKVEDISQGPPIVEEKVSNQTQVTEKINIEPPKAEPVKKVEVGSPTLPKEEESSTIESLDQVKSENLTAKVEEKDVECYPADAVNEKNGEVKVAESGKIEAETEGAPEVKSEEKSVVTEQLVQCEGKPTEDAKPSDPSPKLEEKAVEEKVTDRDINLVAENAKNEDDTVEANKDVSKEPEKIEAAEKIKETVQVDERIEETVEATEAKLEEEKQVNEPTKKADESNKDIEETKKPQSVPVKTQKPSIVKIVKQSLVKAKKAITGKSQNSKPPASEPNKDEGNK